MAATKMSKIQERNIGIRESRRALQDAMPSLEEKHPEIATVFRHLFNWMNNRFLLLQDAVNHGGDERGAVDVHPNVRPRAPTNLPSQPAATTKKRGRPPKNVEEADEHPAKKKRGRPSKKSVEGTTDVTGSTPAAKRRGRPPKNATPVTPSEATPTPKRRGGPPKKSLDGGAEVADDVVTASPKKRGRPPKKSLDGGAEVADDVVTASPKKRGRPPKKSLDGGAEVADDVVTASPKKRGRPPKKSLDGGAEVANDVATASPKRRGRPPKNAAASKSPVTTSPVKSPSGGTSTQKKRGRPPMSDTVAEKEVRASEQGGAEDDPEILMEMQKGKGALQDFVSSFSKYLSPPVKG